MFLLPLRGLGGTAKGRVMKTLELIALVTKH